MSYCLAKANPSTYDLLRALSENETLENWTVGARVKPNDILFIGLSGQCVAGIYARAIVNGKPFLDSGDGEYWIDKERAKKISYYAKVSNFQNHVDRHILSQTLSTTPLLKGVASWLHTQGAVKYLTEKEGEALDRLFGIP